MDAERPACAPWVPGVLDSGQPEERTLEEAEFHRGRAGFSEEEAFTRAFRASEIERLVAELCRAAAVVAPVESRRAESGPGGHLALVDTDIDEFERWFAPAMATLNLMGIETLLPGEGPLPAADLDADGARIHLCHEAVAGHTAGIPDQLDALSGLVRDFQRSGVFVNGLRVVSGGSTAAPQWSLEARHPGIVAAFGEFLMSKYISEAWRLG
ncbi:hypothetical protein [Pseudonocardia sp. GCM10023141]|uniref:hypothetical protein n=1 Tax=Pseudonocardia sp. GCM10023141 TaxID=3252653 RepID=UPI00360A0555